MNQENQGNLSYPKSIFFIIANEFCERFVYYAIRTILSLYLTQKLAYPERTATVIFHSFATLSYFLCIVGAILADSWLGKFKTIAYLSMVYTIGSIILTLGAIPPFHLPVAAFTLIGLTLIAIGFGGIKPCLAAFGGDQFKLPEQAKEMAKFFSLFYFTINAGSLASTSLVPFLRADFQCFGDKDCYALAFGIPSALMIVAVVVFILGRQFYKYVPPGGNMLVLVFKTIGNAISTKRTEGDTNRREHWLDYAEPKHGAQTVDDVKCIVRVLKLYIPLPFFWALHDQQATRWTFQATRMDGDISSYNIKPDQMQMVNPLTVLASIVFCEAIFYPILNKIHVRRPLQKLTLGGILAGISFVLSALIELKLEPTFPVLPSPGYAQLRIFNGQVACDYKFSTNIPDGNEFVVNGMAAFEEKFIPVPGGKFTFEYSIASAGGPPNCPAFADGKYEMSDNHAYSLFMQSADKGKPLIWYEDEVNKAKSGLPVVRTLVNFPNAKQIIWKEVKKNEVVYQGPVVARSLVKLFPVEHKLFIDDTEVLRRGFRAGGVYTVIVGTSTDGKPIANIVKVTEPNSISILWQIPQYVVMALGEVMFVPQALLFSYRQAPKNMKSVMNAILMMTVAAGNCIVVVVAEMRFFKSQAYEYLLFAILMFIDMIIFGFLAYFYQPYTRT